MKKRDLYSFKKGLDMSRFEHPRVTYAVNKNKRVLQATINDMEKQNIEESKEIKEFSKEREELAKKYCAKDEKNKPKLIRRPDPNNPGRVQAIYDIPGEDVEDSPYEKALAKIKKKFKTALDEHKEKMRKYDEEFLDDESEFVPFMLDFEVLEKHEKCPQQIMDLIFWMIKEPKELKT